MKAVEITPTSWVLYDDQESKIGILINRLASYTLMTTEGVLSFADKQDLFDQIGPVVFKPRAITESKITNVGDFPVDEDKVFNISTEGEYPTYTKNENSKIIYAAGYWGLNFSGQYVGAFCPKVNTLKNNENIGPYATKFICNDEVSVANKRLNDE